MKIWMVNLELARSRDCRLGDFVIISDEEAYQGYYEPVSMSQDGTHILTGTIEEKVQELRECGFVQVVRVSEMLEAIEKLATMASEVRGRLPGDREVHLRKGWLAAKDAAGVTVMRLAEEAVEGKLDPGAFYSEFRRRFPMFESWLATREEEQKVQE